MISTSETFQHQGSDMVDPSMYSNQPRPRNDSSPLVMLPAPLARPTGLQATSTSMSGFSRNSEEMPMLGDTGSRSRLIPSPPGDYNGYTSPDAYSPTMPSSIENYVNRGQGGGAVLRAGTMSSNYPGETQNPYGQSQAQAVGYDDEASGTTTTTTTTESDEASMRQQYQQPYQVRARTQSRGFSLADNGPVPGPEGGVRRVSRPQSRRPSSQQPPNNRYSRSSMYGSPTTVTAMPGLPPGAAPPRPYGEYQ